MGNGAKTLPEAKDSTPTALPSPTQPLALAEGAQGLHAGTCLSAQGSPWSRRGGWHGPPPGATHQ